MSRTGSTLAFEHTDIGTRLRPLLELFREEESMVIVCHDDPDPDCLSSALGLKHLARWQGIDAVEVVYGGRISHRQNWAMIDELDIDVRPFDPGLLESRDILAFVDHAVPGRNNPVPTDVEPDVVIDHHPVDTITARYLDSRPSYGATATIVSEYLRTLGVPPDDRLATALLFGIRRETSGFMRRSTTLSEYMAAQYLHPFANMDTIQRLSESLFAEETLDAIAEVIQNREQRGSCLVSNAGVVPNGEAIPLAADYLLNLDGVRTTVVYGVVDNTVRTSARTQNPAIDLGTRLQSAFDDIGSAGGHRNMAGASVPIAALVEEDGDMNLDRVIQTVNRCIFECFDDEP